MRVVRQSGIFEQVGMVEEARILTDRTIYGTIGDMVAYLALAISAAVLLPLGGRAQRSTRTVRTRRVR